MKENFIGKWNLIPDKSIYELGIPPLKATYEIVDDNEYLNVNLHWIDHERKSSQMNFQLSPNGVHIRYEGSPVVDTVMSEFTDENTLNSSSFKDGELTSFASRIIDNSGIMKVIQHLYLPGGNELKNIQYYKK